jgi:cellulose synthase/poly-beta-1,6-N-acetylglucosamine synthase-like glycosyltransferase
MGLSLLIVGALCVVAALHPFTTYPGSLWFARRWLYRPLPPVPPLSPVSKADATALSPSDVAICMCAYNEERVIEEKIANLLALKRKYPGLEVFVYVDAANDGTAEKLREHADEINLHVSVERHGKTHGMNLLVSRVTKPILMFTDANVMIDIEAPAKLMRYFADPKIGCVSGHLKYTNPEASVTAYSGSLYWRLEEWTKRLETDTGSAIGADGSLFALRRDLHRPPPDHIIDDMYVSMMVCCEGYRVVQADDVIAYEENVSGQRDEFWRKVRIASCAFNVHRFMWPRVRELNALLIYKYVSHKWIRWLTIYFLAIGLALVELGLIFAGEGIDAFLLATVATVVLVVGAISSSGPLAQAWDILCAFAATGLGVFRSIRGERMKTWTPVASLRK